MEDKEDEDGSIEVEEDEELSEMKDNLEDHDEEANDLDLESSNSKRSIHINSLNNFSRHLNRSKKSISILDLNGNFCKINYNIFSEFFGYLLQFLLLNSNVR